MKLKDYLAAFLCLVVAFVLAILSGYFISGNNWFYYFSASGYAVWSFIFHVIALRIVCRALNRAAP